MKLAVSYRAEYRYERRVSLSPHTVRLFPRDALQARVLKLDFATNDAGAVRWRHDLFDNVVAQCFYPREDDRLVYRLDAEITVEERNPFGFLLDSRALQWPVEYTPRERGALGAFMATEKTDLPSVLRPMAGSETVNALVTMNQWIHQNIAYERRDEGEAQAPSETLRLRRGACRDTAVLLAAGLRAQGLAARLASGYLWESVTDPAERKAEGALHAWTEVFLPGAGWVGMDPSNGVLADHHYVSVAVGITPDDIAPVKGLYFGDRMVPHTLQMSLEVTREK